MKVPKPIIHPVDVQLNFNQLFFQKAHCQNKHIRTQNTMNFKTPLIHAVLIKRYKRFLADVTLEDGSTLTVHCPNSGSMRGCSTPGSPVCLSTSDNPKRKYPNTLEMIREDSTWIGVNTFLTNKLVVEAIENGQIEELQPYDSIKTEIKTSAHSRLDVMLNRGEKQIYIEIKNCSLVENDCAMFPDAVTSRGTKHLNELARLVQDGHEGYIFFLVQRKDATHFKPATHIDPLYGKTLARVHEHGVKILAYQAEVTPDKISVIRSLPFTF